MDESQKWELNGQSADVVGGHGRAESMRLRTRWVSVTQTGHMLGAHCEFVIVDCK